MKVSEIKAALVPIGENLDAATSTLNQVGPQLDKATKEIKDALAAQDVEIPADAVTALNQISSAAAALGSVASALKVASQALDDLNPDAPAPA